MLRNHRQRFVTLFWLPGRDCLASGRQKWRRRGGKTRYEERSQTDLPREHFIHLAFKTEKNHSPERALTDRSGCISDRFHATLGLTSGQHQAGSCHPAVEAPGAASGHCMIASFMLFSFLRLVGYITDPLLTGREIRQIVGEPARLVQAPPESRELTVVTWNIERGTRFDRVLSTLRALDADIYLLQEVDMFCRRSGERNVAKDLADTLGMNWLFVGEFEEIGESRRGVPALIGQAVLSRYPIEDPSVIKFKVQARARWRLNPVQPRLGGRVALKVRSAGILIYNVHIESVGDDRLHRRQLDEILADEARSGPQPAPVIIAGDFNNAPVMRSAIFSRLSASEFSDALRDDGGPRRTSVHHHHPIDWIFVKHLRPGRGYVADRHAASDHHPVLAVLALEH